MVWVEVQVPRFRAEAFPPYAWCQRLHSSLTVRHISREVKSSLRRLTAAAVPCSYYDCSRLMCVNVCFYCNFLALPHPKSERWNNRKCKRWQLWERMAYALIDEWGRDIVSDWVWEQTTIQIIWIKILYFYLKCTYTHTICLAEAACNIAEGDKVRQCAVNNPLRVLMPLL